MSTAESFIKAALRRCNALQSGESIPKEDAQDLLETMNDLLDSWSTNESYVFGSNEYILNWVPNKNQYKVGPGGDFDIPRPLRITGGYTRFSNLDFWLDCYASQDEYTQILYKAQPGPWPTIAWYNNAMPFGILNVYQTPGNSSELHLFTDTILSNVTLLQQMIMPQGYARALKWNLAKEYCGEFGYPLTDVIKVNARESLDAIKALNAQPPVRAKYDGMLARRTGGDYGYIFHGGYG